MLKDVCFCLPLKQKKGFPSVLYFLKDYAPKIIENCGHHAIIYNILILYLGCLFLLLKFGLF